MKKQQTKQEKRQKQYLVMGYLCDDDYCCSDTMDLDPNTIGKVPSEDNGACALACAHLQRTRELDRAPDRIWIVDCEIGQVVGDYWS